MEDLKPVKSGKVKVDDVNLYYEIYGQGDPLGARRRHRHQPARLGAYLRCRSSPNIIKW